MASGSVCSASGCNLYAGNSRGVSFFRFPRDPKRCKKWVTNCCQKDLKGFLKRSTEYLYFNHKLCANHFDDSQFANKMRNRLIPNAVPTLFDVPGKMANPALKATQGIAAGDKVTHASDHATVGPTDGSSRASKRKLCSKDPSCGIYLEMFSDAKLMLTPAVVLERVTLPELQRKEIQESSRSQPEVVGLDEPETKTPVQRENAVKRLKQNLQKLKHELDKEQTWHKNHESYAEMVEHKHQRKVETVERVRSSQLQSKQTSYEVLRADELVERKGNNQLQKQANHEALLASPFWIKVEEASNAPTKKVYYIFSGANGTLDPNAITATNLPGSVSRHQGEVGKAILSTSKNNPHEAKSMKTNEIKSENTMLHMMMYGNPDEISEKSLYGTKSMKSNEEQGDGRIERERTVHTTPNDTSKKSPDGNKNRNSNEGKAGKRKSQDSSMVLVLTTADGQLKYKCTKCRKCFRRQKGLLIHIAVVHSHKSYECYVCRTEYKDKKQFNLHLNEYHKPQFTKLKNDCHICGKRFNSRPRHAEHMALHAQKIFGCNACKASFVEVVDMKGHLPCPLATAGMPPILCLKCGETFDTRIQIQRHAACNHSLTPKTANDYKKSYSFSQKEKTGNTAKYKGRQYACETCGKKFRLVQALSKHLPCAPKICEACDKQFESEARLDLHVALCHSDEAVKCSLCGSRFVSRRKLTAHEKLFKGHCQGQLFVCNYCGQTTKHASGFSKHVQTHDRKNDSRIVRSKIKLETDLSDKCSINAQEMVGCESDPEFLSVD